jgi:hypothetical protein
MHEPPCVQNGSYGAGWIGFCGLRTRKWWFQSQRRLGADLSRELGVEIA